MKYIIRKVQSQSYDKGRNGNKVSFLILHYTAAGFQSSLNVLVGKDIQASSHYLVPDPTEKSYPEKEFFVFQLVEEQDTAWHAGRSAWQNTNRLNPYSIGIEIVNLASYADGKFTFPAYNNEQINAVIELCRDILKRYPDIHPTHVLGHSDISPGRKSDPDPMFPWKKLYENGIGAWYDVATQEKHACKLAVHGMPAIKNIQEDFKRYGYKIHVTEKLDTQTKNVIKTFQAHFRPEKVDGILDIETIAILSALNEKYI